MTLTPVKETHVYLDEKGQAWIKRAGVSVKQVVISLKEYDYKASEVVRAYPYLMLSEVHAALSYYYDHRSEIDEALRKDQEFEDELRAATPESPLQKQLRESGRLP